MYYARQKKENLIMLKSALIAAALVTAATLPAYSASMPMSKCDDASMMSMNEKIGGMTNESHKKMAMKEMAMAKTSMTSHKMKTCGVHMDRAMKYMGTM
jgi:hypothetical protein